MEGAGEAFSVLNCLVRGSHCIPSGPPPSAPRHLSQQHRPPSMVRTVLVPLDVFLAHAEATAQPSTVPRNRG